MFENKTDESDIKIIDFGLSKIFKDGSKFIQLNQLVKGSIQRMQTRAGTPYYISPEVLTGNYNEQCDLWSCGCILYIFLCGYPPFYGDNDQEILQMVRSGEFEFDGEEWDDVSA